MRLCSRMDCDVVPCCNIREKIERNAEPGWRVADLCWFALIFLDGVVSCGVVVARGWLFLAGVVAR